jgi:hypothetical protein
MIYHPALSASRRIGHLPAKAGGKPTFQAFLLIILNNVFYLKSWIGGVAWNRCIQRFYCSGYFLRRMRYTGMPARMRTRPMIASRGRVMKVFTTSPAQKMI